MAAHMLWHSLGSSLPKKGFILSLGDEFSFVLVDDKGQVGRILRPSLILEDLWLT